jgi:hypothetical protein
MALNDFLLFKEISGGFFEEKRIPSIPSISVTSTLTLSRNSWDGSKEQTLSVSGVTANSVLLTSMDNHTMTGRWANAQVLIVAKSTNSVKFKAVDTPTEDIEFKLVILNAN